MDKKAKLKTNIEREMQKHISEVREGVFDFVMLYIKKNDPRVFDEERPLLTSVLAIVANAIESEHLNKIDMLLNRLDSSLDEFVKDEDK